MTKIPITYIGFSEELILFLINSNFFELKCVISQKDRLTPYLLSEIGSRGIPFFFVKSKEDLPSIRSWLKGKIVLMFKFGFILPNELTREIDIFNIHAGDLKTNRGAHSLNWSILLGEKTTCLSLYKVSDKVDLGLLIKTYSVEIFDSDDVQMLEKRLILGLPILIEALHKFLNGQLQGINVDDGVYRKKIAMSDYKIDANKDSLEIIQRKINSQRSYSGAVIELNGFRFYVMKVEKLTPN